MKKVLLKLIVCLVLSSPLWAQEADTPSGPVVQLDQLLYFKGDTNIAVHAGAFFPLFAGGFNFQNVAPLTLRVGFNIGADIDVHWNNNFKMGGGINFSTSSGINGTTANFIGLFYRAFWEFHIYSWSFPVGGSVGVQIASYGEWMAVNPVIRPEVGVFYNFTSKWSVGLTVVWSTTLQPVWKNIERSRVGNMLEISLAGRYYF
jgi:hypothetical protein